ncbi:TPR-domain containing protein [Flavobacterium limnosediminis JC2902]|uniref:TPR-domain containing protein n=1 Tax=Flavobacterium limnosediminis JC2902 TaxID=1341181 RepID=V6SGY7_9FLAO|nr:tetratricopeptide repeat protein [Flavobacterium limnosediminis]ESU25846.1 TPR-domain containing protein [Flavobacterium limnosediminis JC2902]
MRKLNRFLYTSLILSAVNLSAQQSNIYTHELTDFDKAVALYKDRQYNAAQIIFNRVKSSNVSYEVKSDCAYYNANCAIRLEQPGADVLIEDFVEQYPTSSKQNQAFIEVAHYYFDQSNYPQALKYFEKVDEGSMSNEEREKFNFQKGYCYFSAKNKKEADKYFNKVANSKEFGSQAKYYLGYMAYETDNYKDANKYFDQVQDQDKYKEKMSYFQADMNFKLGNFQKAIDLGVPQLSKSNAEEKSELSKIIGESYFNLKQYDKALPYLLNYKGKKGKWNNTDFYQLGYAYYKAGDFENAIAQFNKIIEGQDAVAQNAYYHLGESYLKVGKKQEALNAFKNASEMEFDLKIQEDAYLNYAKISYEIGNPYQSVPEVLQAYLAKYPQTAYKQEIENLLINSYITSKNYKEALSLLEKNKNPQNRPAYQKVTFYRGLELYTDGNYKEALTLFKKSIAEPRDAKFTARATFWKGETEYNLDQFGDALISFKQFSGSAEAKSVPEAKNASYNLAYTYFKLKEYENAANHFQEFIKTEKADKVRLNDAYLRMGDSYFVTSKYWPAMDAYNKAVDLNSVDADYAHFQKAISYGFVGKNDLKIENLNSFMKKHADSKYADDALYELGNTYVTQNNVTKAVETYDRLIDDYKESSYVSKSILRQGLVYYNNDKDQQALVKFKEVVSKFPRTEEANEAVATARLIYMDNNKVNEYAAWVKTLDFVEVSNADLDNDTYNAAEKQYLQNNSKQAISGFSGYLANFPEGLHALKANFYLAQLYFADGLGTTAIPNYEYVIGKSRSEYTEQSLARLCEIHLKNKTYERAIPVLQRLESEADFPQNVTFAQSNLMKCYYEQKEFANAVVYADKVLANPKTDDKVKSDAQIIVARSAIKTNDEVKAKEAYAKLQKIAKGELAAEALYYDAYFKNKEGKFEKSNEVVQKLAKDYSGYKYFGAKGLIVMAKNFYGLKDSFQATYILESVIKNFASFEEVVTEAQTELDFIKGEEAKRNSSITK